MTIDEVVEAASQLLMSLGFCHKVLRIELVDLHTLNAMVSMTRDELTENALGQISVKPGMRQYHITDMSSARPLGVTSTADNLFTTPASEPPENALRGQIAQRQLDGKGDMFMVRAGLHMGGVTRVSGILLSKYSVSSPLGRCPCCASINPPAGTQVAVCTEVRHQCRKRSV